MSSPLTGKRGAVYKRYKKLEDDRSSWRSHWIELTDYLLPRRGRYLIESQNSRGRKRNSKILDNTGGYALRTLQAGMMSGMTSPARPWFRLRTPDTDRMDQPGVRDFLTKSQMVIGQLLGASNFYNSVSQVYRELGAFGTSPMLRRPHPNKLIHFRPYTAGEYVIAENDLGEVDTLGREFTMTVAQIVEMFVWDRARQEFDWSKCSKAVQNLWNSQNYDELVVIVHMIQPRRAEMRDTSRIDGPNRPIMDVYFEKGADNDTLLRDSGFMRQPFYCPRWDVLGGDIYGYSPGMETLPDIKQLQHEQRRKAQALDKMVTPPMVATPNLKGRKTTTLPGGTTYADPINGGAGFQPAYQVDPRIQELTQDIREVQDRIQRGFYADLFAMMINSDRRQITATEVVERHEEKLTLLGPVLQRLNVDMLDPLIEDTFRIAMTNGLLPEPPEALREDPQLEVKYVSLLAQAQEAAGAASIERVFSFAGNLSAVSPSVMDNLDEDEAIRQYGDILGTGPEILRDGAEVDAIRQARAERESEVAEMEALQVEAQAAATLASADTQTPNALTALLQGGGGVARRSIQ